MKLLSVVLLLLPLSACLAEVMTDFRSCKVNNSAFFPTVNGVVSPPTIFTGPDFKQICQTRNNQPEFATFYDTVNKIPVYSSYRFYKPGGCDRKSAWLIEPQLEDTRLDRNMASEAEVRKEMKKLSNVSNVVKQAWNGDYEGHGHVYHKGHLAPVHHAHSQSCSDATFTLTNAAPQHKSFNGGQWRVTEAEVAKVLAANCINNRLSVYVVTGVVPGNDTINNGVRVPSHYWTAYCCFDNNNRSKLSGGYIGENSKANLQPIQKSVRDLEMVLTGEYKKHFPNHIPNNAFTLFAGKCR